MRVPANIPSTDGVDVAVHDLGLPFMGPPSLGQSSVGDDTDGAHPLLVSHATGFHGRCYLPLARHLAARPSAPLQAIAFDYRGHGDTPRPHGPVDWHRYGDDVEAVARWLRDTTGEAVDAFGHSMGGACLLMVAARQPGLFRRLVVFEPIVFPPEGLRPEHHDDADPDDNPMVRGARRRRAVFASHQAAIDNYGAKPPLSIFTAESLEAYVVHGFAPDPDGVRLKCSPDTEAETFATGTRHDTWERLPSIDIPTLVIAGRVEHLQPSSISRAIADRLPRGRYLELGHLSHFGPMSHPGEIADLVADALS